MSKFVIRRMPIFILIDGVSAAQAEKMNIPPKPQEHMKPPPEAITACKGKSEGYGEIKSKIIKERS